MSKKLLLSLLLIAAAASPSLSDEPAPGAGEESADREAQAGERPRRHPVPYVKDGFAGRWSIYGARLMSKEERKEFRHMVLEIEHHPDVLQDFLELHARIMDARAAAQNTRVNPPRKLTNWKKQQAKREAEARGEGHVFLGAVLMTEEERAAHRAKLREKMSSAERSLYLYQHFERMRRRAEEQGIPYKLPKDYVPGTIPLPPAAETTEDRDSPGADAAAEAPPAPSPS